MKQPRLELAISPTAMRMLQRLATLGLYGRNVAGVARGFLYEGLRRHLVETGQVRKK